ncbi:MAG TPA: dual specificity protein phosphatase family protein [Geobacteraceae bacterium]
MKTTLRFILACLIVTATNASALGTGSTGDNAASVRLPSVAHTSEHVYGNLPGLANVGRVALGLLRGAQPAAEGYATLKRIGVRTVINLRTSMSEKKEVEAAGMRSIEVPMEMSTDHIAEKIDRVVALMADPANQPVFVHCRHGQDRTGIVVAAYRMKVEGWPLAEAEQEMQAFGFNDVWVNFKRFIRRYAQDMTM